MNTVQIIQILANFVTILANIITYAIIGRVLFSWFKMAGQSHGRGRLEQFLYDITDPVLNIVKKVPHSYGMMDFSPIMALLAIDLLSQLIIMLLYKIVS